jgi:hypothetical protein
MNESQKSKASLMSAEALSEAVKEYQRFAQINETGKTFPKVTWTRDH